MSFKIVKTLENGTVNISAVPTAWEENGILWWPKCSQIVLDKLRCNKYSVPDETWTKYSNATVKAKNIESFHEAIKIEIEFAGFNDTDTEEM